MQDAKPIAAAAIVATAISALVIFQPAPTGVNISLACDTPPAGCQVCWYAGNRSGRYCRRVLGDASGSFTFTNLDPTLPWYFNATLYQTLVTPITNCFTGIAGMTACRITQEIEGERAGELVDLLPPLLPFLDVSNGIATLTGYGRAGTNYSVYKGDDPQNATNLVLFLTGINSPWTYSEPIGTIGFFRTTAAAAVNSSSTIQ